MPAGDEAESTTKATIAEGEIEIRDKENQKQDLAGLNRDAQNSLNKLGEIFDRDTVKERQELAGLFGEIAYKAVGDLAAKNSWEDGSAEKTTLHALVGGIMSELGDSSFLAGASGAAVNEMIQDKLSDMFKDDPAMHQWASALIGGVVSEIVSGNAQSGASTAASATKNNRLTHGQYLEYLAKIKEAADKGDIGTILELVNEYGNKDGGAITTANGVYEVYVDSRKYSGKDLTLATLIDISAVVVSLEASSYINDSTPEKIGYLIPLADGTVAYFINKASKIVKSKTLDN